MSMDLVILMGILSVAAAIVLLSRVVGIRFILRHATWVDVGFGVACGLALHGSTVGILIAIVAGLVMALVLQSGRVLLRAYDRGYETGRGAVRAVMRRETVRPQQAAMDPRCDPAMPHVDFGA